MYMDNIKLFVKNEKQLESDDIYSDDIWMEFSIEKCAIFIIKIAKRQMTKGIELPNKKKIRTLREKEIYSIGNGHLQTSADERKNLKSVSQKNEKTSRNQSILQKSHERNKHLVCPSRKILGTILEVDEGRTSTNGPKNKKTRDDAYGLTSQRWCMLGITYLFSIMSCYGRSGDQSVNKPTSQTRRAVPIVEVYHYSITNPMFLLLIVSLL